MITKKLKTCCDCLKPSILWKGKRCGPCSYKYDKSIGKERVIKAKTYSDSMIKKNVEYIKLRLEYLNSHKTCEIGIRGICKSFSAEIHHSAGRTGKLLTEVKYFKAACRPCHYHTELHPEWAKENGFSVSRLDK